jgi:hypothetical protein
MTLADRCTKVLRDFDDVRDTEPPSLMRGKKMVDYLKNFVLSEVGRASDEAFGDGAPLVLYFADEASREEFMAIVMEAKPNWISKRWPE